MDAAAWKAKGNEHFSAKNFDDAIEAFSKAIELDGTNHVLYSNRSASYASLNKYAEAKADAEKCVALNGTWAKGYVRLGAALHGAGDLDAAKQAYEQGLQVEPENASLKSGLESLEQDMKAGGGANDTFSKLFGPDCLAKARANPKLAPYCAQPDYVQKMNMIAQNPTMAQAMMQDQRIMHTMLEFSGIDMGALGKQDAPAQPQPTQQQSAPAPSKPAAAPSKPAAAPKPELTPAQKVKEEGNALYKKRMFDEALAKYKEAAELEPTNTTFLLNQTAVHFEMGNYELCFDEVEKALEHAREHKAEYTAVAKLMTRKASCLQKMQKYDEAVELFQKALLEHRNAETLTKLDACKAERKKAEAEAYFDEEKGKIAKDEGNVHFKENRYPEAVKCYDEAEKRNPNDHTIYSNRAAALLRLMAYEDVIRDCDKCLAIKPDFVKAVTRKAHAYFWTKQYTKAMAQYDEAIKIDPTFQEAVEGKHKTMMKIQENASGEGDEEAAQRAMQDPEIQGILQDSYMQLVLSEMQKDPKKINDYMRDPGISAKLNKLIMAGVLRVGNQPAGAGGKGGRR